MSSSLAISGMPSVSSTAIDNTSGGSSSSTWSNLFKIAFATSKPLENMNVWNVGDVVDSGEVEKAFECYRMCLHILHRQRIQQSVQNVRIDIGGGMEDFENDLPAPLTAFCKRGNGPAIAAKIVIGADMVEERVERDGWAVLSVCARVKVEHDNVGKKRF
ncbi:hypothetical protein HK102_006232 [Quaeritorhiza haematococci]|nr:hypothetical protein HK102_006232 [Quaeritorhiza haematococci]